MAAVLDRRTPKRSISYGEGLSPRTLLVERALTRTHVRLFKRKATTLYTIASASSVMLGTRMSG
jgi:hypothetical protein